MGVPVPIPRPRAGGDHGETTWRPRGDHGETAAGSGRVSAVAKDPNAAVVALFLLSSRPAVPFGRRARGVSPRI